MVVLYVATRRQRDMQEKLLPHKTRLRMALSLSSIKKVQDNKPPRVVIYGKDKMGKSTFAHNAPDPIFIFTEDGKNPDIEPETFVFDTSGRYVAQSINEIFDAIRVLATESHEFGTVVIDSLTNLEKLIWKALCAKYGEESIVSNRKGSPFAWGRGYELAMDLWKQFTDCLDYLRNEKRMAVVCVGHAKQRIEKPADQEQFSQYCPDIHCPSNERNTGSSALEHFNRWADAILFVDTKTFTRKDQAAADQKKTRILPSGGTERVIYTEARPQFVAGNRYSLPPELPFPKHGSWQIFQNEISKSLSK